MPDRDHKAIWPFHWLVEMKGALPDTIISATQFPRVFAWIERFRAVLKKARASVKPITVSGADVLEFVGKADFAETAGEVDGNDPLGLKAGDEVEVFPIDSGSSHRDRGRLVTLTPHEATVAKRTRDEAKEIHVCVPRWGFRVVRVGDEDARL